MNTNETISGDIGRFFTSYADALLARDESAMAELYAVPALVLFPGQSIAVSDADQTKEFFASSWAQYEGVTDAEPSVSIVAQSPHSVWADVTWKFGGEARERFIYQLVAGGAGWQVAVLTPLKL